MHGCVKDRNKILWKSWKVKDDKCGKKGLEKRGDDYRHLVSNIINEESEIFLSRFFQSQSKVTKIGFNFSIPTGQCRTYSFVKLERRYGD